MFSFDKSHLRSDLGDENDLRKEFYHCKLIGELKNLLQPDN